MNECNVRARTRMSRYFPAITICVAWLAFIVSLFLPATNIFEWPNVPPRTVLLGWQASVSSIIFVTTQLYFALLEPRILLYAMVPIMNLCMFLAPAAILSPGENVWMLSGLFLLMAIIPWLLPSVPLGNLFIGFYVWNASFILMGIGFLMMRDRISEP